jgi:hypothetical protein
MRLRNSANKREAASHGPLSPAVPKVCIESAEMATWRSALNAKLNQARDRLVSMRVWLRFVALIADLEHPWPPAPGMTGVSSAIAGL